MIAENIFTLLFLPGLLFFGSVTTYEDLKEGKIRNKWILFAIIYSLAMLIVFLIYLKFQNMEYNLNFLALYFTNVGGALVIGVAIWYMGFWSAADAKLFVGYSAIFPLTLYKVGNVEIIPSYVLLINTFVPLFLFMLVVLLFKTSLKDKLMVFKELFSIRMMSTLVLFLFGFMWVLSLIFMFFKIRSNFFIDTMLLFVFLLVLNRLPGEKLRIMIGLCIVRLIFDYNNILNLAFLWNFLIMFAIFVALVFSIAALAFRLFSKEIYVENLKPGMILAESLVMEKDAYRKQKIVHFSFIQALLEKTTGKHLVEIGEDGLTKKEVRRIIHVHNAGKLKDHTLLIRETYPFAPFMFFGVLLTILAQGNFPLALAMLF
jgi:hypothetical protein